VWFRRPELAPDRRHLVLEGRPVTLIRHTDEAGNLLFTDTIMGRSGDIWRYDF
jgi:hypothetical protein